MSTKKEFLTWPKYFKGEYDDPYATRKKWPDLSLAAESAMQKLIEGNAEKIDKTAFFSISNSEIRSRIISSVPDPKILNL